MQKTSSWTTKNWMYLCAITGITSLLFGLLALCLHYWILAVILLLITVRQAIVYPKWRKKLKMEKEAANDRKQ